MNTLPPLPLNRVEDLRATDRDVALLNGEEYVYFVSRSGGWTTVERDGVAQKVRNGNVRVLSRDEVAGLVAAHATPPSVVEKILSSPVKGGVVLKEYRQQLHRTKVEVQGRKRILVDCNDEVAQSLRGRDLAETYKIVAEKLAEDDGTTTADATETLLRTKYAHLNPGQQRMNLGNVLRRLLRTA